VGLKTQVGNTETLIGWLIVLLLVVIAAVVLVKQSRYDTSLFAPPAVQENAAPTRPGPPADSSELQAYLPGTLKALTPLETFGPDTLSDKIDGKAELYLAAGFRSMRCQRFMLADHPEAWLEVFVYDMGNLRNAFAVYSGQRRADAEKVELTRFAYRTANALFFVQGQDYVEIVASEASPELTGEILAYAQNLVAKKPANSEPVSELALFPAKDLDDGTIALLASDVFSFERLNHVFTASYTVNGNPVTAFLSMRATPAEAVALAAAYLEFLTANGGSPASLSIDVPGASLVQLFDTFELVFTRGRVLAGVHEAPDQETGEQLAMRLYQGLTEVTP
jgi:hypothetical protein